jgi:coenzyme Q-binding protein COQ10
MPSFRTSRRVRHSAENMFALVADVETYPQFLPLCQSLVVRQREVDEAGNGEIVADMRVGYKAIRESFTSRVTLDRPNLTIDVEYVEGPFRSLQNRWTFEPDPQRPDAPACVVTFSITYEFRSRMLSMLMGSMFDQAFRRFAESFERRADQVYGRENRSAPPASRPAFQAGKPS